MKAFKISIAIISICLIAGFFYINKKHLDSKQKLANAQKQIEELKSNNETKDGDLIFQISLSGQSKAIQLATHSQYSHCGIIYTDKDSYFVLEAVQPVKRTPLDKWIARGQNGHYVIKRLKNADQVLTASALQKMKQEGYKFIGKGYDLTFEWSDEKIYCSELIYKIYDRALNIKIGKLQTLKDFDLSSDAVKHTLKERYGTMLPFDEPVISPAGIVESELLETIKTD